jgi:hypothetical protein
MNAEDAIHAFFSRVLIKERRGRYLALIGTKKGRRKFLADLYHGVEDRIDRSRVVAALPQRVLDAPAYSYSSQDGFGHEEVSMSDGLSRMHQSGGWFVISQDGKHGVYTPEDDMNGQVALNV